MDVCPALGVVDVGTFMGNLIQVLIGLPRQMEFSYLQTTFTEPPAAEYVL